jgi:hypothetical protein
VPSKKSGNRQDARYDFSSHDLRWFSTNLTILTTRFSPQCFFLPKTDCGIFQIGNNARFKVPPPPVEGVETVASVLNVENDLVFNCLADISRIDQIALCKDHGSSEEKLLYINAKGEEALKGIIKTVYILPDADNWTVKNGSKAVFTNEQKLRKTIGVDKSAAVQQAKTEEEQLKKEMQLYHAEESKLEHEHTKYQREWNHAKKAMQKNDEKIHNLTSKIEDIRTEIDTSANVTIDTTEYEQDVENYEQEMEALEQDDEKLSNEIESLQPEIEDTKSSISDCAIRNEKVLAEMQTADQNLTHLLESRSQHQDIIEKRRQRVEKHRAAIDAASEKEVSLRADQEAALLTARQMMFKLRVFEKIRKGMRLRSRFKIP